MAPRCFVFSPDEGTSDVIRQVLTGLDVEMESCPEAATAGEKIAKDSFQLVVIDWDQQPDATAMLTAARERKVSERPLILAIVSDDPSVPKALQAGANSILRRPLMVNQVKDTLTTAHELLRARQGSAMAAHAAAAASAASVSTASEDAKPEPGSEGLRSGEFSNAAPAASGGGFETDATPPSAQDLAVAEHVSPLMELEPVATSMPAPLPPPPPDEPRSLEELLRSRGVGRRTGPPEPPASSAGAKPELLGFEQTSSHSSASAAAPARAREQRKEPELFSSIIGESEPPKASAPRFRQFRGLIVVAAILAGCGVVLAPQAPWHAATQGLWAHGRRSFHTWLNPQPVTTPVAPAAHEDFGRAGDEYKLPVAEAIPDATTDPSQIHVVPVVDPTAKKSNNGAAGQDQPTVIDTPATTPAEASQPSATPTPDNHNPPPQPTPAVTQPVAAPTPAVTASPAPAATVPPTTAAPTTAQNPNESAVTYTAVSPSAPPKRQPVPYIPPPAPKVPSSLQSQMATMVPDASGNKAPEAAMQSIEPVAVTELTERALLNDQPPLDFPAAAGGQHGTVILQVLIGRDGNVQDAKFLQGSLAFARAAIDGVRQWKFKPYMMNGRPVSVQTTLTLKFPPQ
jgi:periplasmic protein TonB